MSTPRTPAPPILVTGATGSVGGALVDQLADTEQPFTVMCRRRDQQRDFTDRGVRAVLGDLGDRDSVRDALEGCEQLFLLTTGAPDLYQHSKNGVDAARDAGVRHVVRVSGADASPTSPITWAREYGRADDYLRRSGLPWTILQPSSFMKNLLGVAPLIRRGLLPGSSGHGAVTWIDVADVGAAAHATLTDPATQGGSGDDGRSYLLTATQPLSYPQVCDIMTRQLRHRVRYLHIPGPALRLGVRLSGGSRWEADGLVAQFAVVVRRGLDNVRVFSTELADLLDRPPVSMETFVDAHAAAFTTGSRL